MRNLPMTSPRMAALFAAPLFIAAAIGGCDKPPDAPPTEPPTTPATPAEPEATEPEAAEPEVAAEDQAWADMDFAAKKKFMSTEYYPAMKEAFQGHDGEYYAEFTCNTCHGDNAKEVGFELPNDLIPLSTDDPIAAGNDMDEATTKFMMEVVVPKTAELMDRPTWSPETPEGVGCFTCHNQG